MRYATSVLASATLLLAPSALSPSVGDNSDWLARVRQSLGRREYHASGTSDGLQAPNRAQNLRTYFDATGIRVHDRTARSELLSLTLSGIGRSDVVAPLSPGVVTSVGPRVEIRREGVVEWYENSAAGLEQGFTLAERPAGEGPLVVELALKGATARLRDDAVVFSATSGRRLRYGQLVAIDAAGVRLAARLTVSGAQRVGIEVDDTGARYPVIIDPLLWGTADAVIAADQVAASFESLAGAGDVNGDGYDDVVVGVPGYDVGGGEAGAAFLFLGSETGLEDADVSAADAILQPDRPDTRFGTSVAGAGDVNGDGYDDLIVGAPEFGLFDENGYGYTGAAFVFFGSASGIQSGAPGATVARIVSDHTPYTTNHSAFGTSVAGVGDLNGDGFADVVVGAPYQNDGQQNPGAVYVFLGSATGIVATDAGMAAAKLESGSLDSWVGWTETGAGDVNGDGYDDLIVGARRYDWFYWSSYGTGSAFVFMGSSSGIAAGDVNSAATRLDHDQQWQEFGYDVAGAGDVNHDGYDDVIVASNRYDYGQAAAFVFLGSASGIADGGPGSAANRIDAAGAVASAGDVNGDAYDDVVVGGLVFLGGAAGVAHGDPDTAVSSLQAIPGSAYFGEKVAGIGDVNGDGYADVIVGAAFLEGHSYTRGGAFVYLGQAFADPNGDPELVDSRIASDRKGAELGINVAGAGDLNADGYDDVIVRVPQYDRGNGFGANFVFLGSASGIANTEALDTAIRIDAGGVATRAGDVNGDGYDDVIATFGYGDVLVYLGSASGIADGSIAAAATRLSADATGGFASVAAAGDVNGDGYDDVIIGGQFVDSTNATYPGAAFIFLGSASGIANGGPATAATRLVTDQPDSWFGQSVSGAGDVNGDGYDDVIVGAVSYQVPVQYDTHNGAAFIFLGSASGIPNGGPGAAATWIQSEEYSNDFGESVAGAGDVNGDGYGDVIVGAPRSCCGGGAAFLFHGSSSGIPDGAPDTASTLLSASPYDPEWGYAISNRAVSSFGASVASAGDVNGDGYDDVVVGAPTSYAGQSDEGAVFVFLGSASGVAKGELSSAAGQLESNRRYAELGTSVAGAGDVNGDGYDDVIAGAPGFYPGGAAFVFLGEADGDFRGAPNSHDNCTLRTNPLQHDGDGDGFGDPCDADFDQNGVAGIADFGTFRRCFGQYVSLGGEPTADAICAKTDMDGDGFVGIADFGLFKSEFGTPPGP